MQHPAARAAASPGKLAAVVGGSGERRTYRALEEASNRVAQLLRSAGLRTGDHVAVLLTNRLDWYDVVWGALRAGLYVTPVNFHLTAAEAGYIVRDCGARAMFADAELPDTVGAMAGDLGGVEVRVAVGGRLDGFEDLGVAVSACPPVPIADEVEGTWMLYKCPTEIRFVDELPRLPTGKLLKRALLR